MKEFELVIVGGGLTAACAGQSEELEAVVKELIGERAPLDALARELVGARSR